MTQEKFEKLVKEGIEAIPERFLNKLKNVDIVIEDEPTAHQLDKLKAKKNSFILGLYEGIPQTKRQYYGQVLPDKITIFKKPIEEIANSCQRPASPAKRGEQSSSEAAEEEIRQIVKNTVWHEIAHHFGLDEKEIRIVENRLRKNI